MTRHRWKTLAWAGTLGVLVMCFLPRRDVPALDAWGLDKLVHAAAFFAVGFCWCRATGNVRGAILIGLLLAVGTEVIQQAFIDGRHGDVLDIVADAFGLTLGTLLAARARVRA